MDRSTLSALSRCAAFDALDGETLLKTVQAVSHQVKRYGRKAIIHFQGDAYDALIVLLRGEIDAVMQDYDGKTLRIETMRGPELLAPGVLFAEDNALPVTLTAKSDVEVLVFPKSSVIRMGTRSPEFLLSFLRDSGNRIVFLAGKLSFSQFTTLRQKAASYLLDCVRKQRTETVALEHSKEALAELFGATRPSVSRAFSGLRDDGLIQLDGRTVYILSMGGLKKVVSAV